MFRRACAVEILFGCRHPDRAHRPNTIEVASNLAASKSRVVSLSRVPESHHPTPQDAGRERPLSPTKGPCWSGVIRCGPGGALATIGARSLEGGIGDRSPFYDVAPQGLVGASSHYG
jgi:hypothetical protein